MIRVLIMGFRQLLMALDNGRADFVPPNATHIDPHSQKHIDAYTYIYICPPAYHHTA